jgi:hypothetical protein
LRVEVQKVEAVATHAPDSSALSLLRVCIEVGELVRLQKPKKEEWITEYQDM